MYVFTRILFASLLIAAVSPSPSSAQLRMTTLGSPVIERFDSFLGTGISPTPTGGELDSNVFRFTGLSDASAMFGDEVLTGDHARGQATGGVSLGGVYAFTAGGSSNPALGLQPTGGDFTPGSAIVRLQNATGAPITEVEVSFIVYELNDEGRSVSYELEYSLDGASWSATSVSAATAEAADVTPRWRANPYREAIDSLTLSNGDLFFIRLKTNDVPGMTMLARDELAWDDIAVTPRRAGTSCMTPADCEDGNPCTTHTCRASVCETSDLPAGSSCGDSDACNGDETCDGAGGCAAGAPLECADADPCTRDGCDAMTGCVFETIGACCMDDTDCEDGDECTADICAVGNTCRNDEIPACGMGDAGPGDSGVPDSGVPMTDTGVPMSDSGSSTTDSGGTVLPMGEGRRGGGGCSAGGRFGGGSGSAALIALLGLVVGVSWWRRRRAR